MSVGGPYDQGCASDVNGCLGALIALIVIGFLVALALDWLGVL